MISSAGLTTAVAEVDPLAMSLTSKSLAKRVLLMAAGLGLRIASAADRRLLAREVCSTVGSRMVQLSRQRSPAVVAVVGQTASTADRKPSSVAAQLSWTGRLLATASSVVQTPPAIAAQWLLNLRQAVHVPRARATDSPLSAADWQTLAGQPHRAFESPEVRSLHVALLQPSAAKSPVDDCCVVRHRAQRLRVHSRLRWAT
jgi:hypothetical protein